ncbi:MAG: hypothetical protein AW09_002790 [Candidatus Accumulibacter phosphatis]|uniref:HEPN domain-containing protein n=1 Tax=Candidatus Accumulibacter phosphatis TaxID=327160 RepID=A0A080LWA7_9PROT|nr:MAG: hypothetical protein AW09_002790 [Candidatus Accumulibacter phosphatis]HRF13420.1 hypothetical protein [Candidatus Accumulibacter phosphatis]
MAYPPNMPAAARRHIEAADILFAKSRGDVAGYLYGIAAECALKAMMLEAGMRPSETRRDDPFSPTFRNYEACCEMLHPVDAAGRLCSA